jgi:hypothetical protein
MGTIHRAPSPSPPPLRVAKTGKNHLNEEITSLLPFRIGKRFSQTISNLGHAALLRRCELLLQTKVRTISGGPLVNSQARKAEGSNSPIHAWVQSLSSQSTHRVATVTFWRTFHHDGKISPGWWGWGVQAHLLSLYLPSRAKLWCTLQLRGQIHFPYFYSTPMCTMWWSWLGPVAWRTRGLL